MVNEKHAVKYAAACCEAPNQDRRDGVTVAVLTLGIGRLAADNLCATCAFNYDAPSSGSLSVAGRSQEENVADEIDPNLSPHGYKCGPKAIQAG